MSAEKKRVRFHIGPTYDFEQRTSTPKLVVNIGWKSYEQKCVGVKDGQYEFELSNEVLDYNFNNIKIKHNDLDDPSNMSSLFRSHDNPLIIECKELSNCEFSTIPMKRSLFYYNKKDIRLRDICTTLHLKRNYDVGDFEIYLTRGLRNRIRNTTPAFLFTLFPIGPMLILAFEIFLWIVYFIQVVIRIIA